MKISVIMVVHNEAENVVKTLASVYGWVEEIVIVDGFSTDTTVENIRDFEKKNTKNGQTSKIQIYQEENHANFIINKQKALEKATQEWILELDADELVSLELKNEILALSEENAASQSSSYVAYWIPRLNHFLGSPLRKGGQYPDYTIRLYKRSAARFPQKSIHDQVEINGKQTVKSDVVENADISKLKAPILHYPYKNIAVFFRKWAQYAMFEGDQSYARGVRTSFSLAFSYLIMKPFHWFFLTYFRHKGFVDGLAGFMFSLLSAKRFWVEYLRIYELQKSQQN